MQKFHGNTEDASAPIIGAGYWKKGTQIKGIVTGVFKTTVGPAYNLTLDREISVPGDVLSPEQKGTVTGTEFSVGALKGFEMALRAAGVSVLIVGDQITIKCTGSEDTGKGSPRVNFDVEVIRP